MRGKVLNSREAAGGNYVARPFYPRGINELYRPNMNCSPRQHFTISCTILPEATENMALEILNNENIALYYSRYMQNHHVAPWSLYSALVNQAKRDIVFKGVFVS